MWKNKLTTRLFPWELHPQLKNYMSKQGVNAGHHFCIHSSINYSLNMYSQVSTLEWKNPKQFLYEILFYQNVMSFRFVVYTQQEKALPHSHPSCLRSGRTLVCAKSASWASPLEPFVSSQLLSEDVEEPWLWPEVSVTKLYYHNPIKCV